MPKTDTPTAIIRFPVDARFTVQTLGYIQYTSPWCHFPRRCNEYILYFVESGDLYVEEDGVRWHAGQNTALLLEPGKFHVGYQMANVSYYFIHFTCSRPLVSSVLTEELREQIIQLHVDFLNSAFIYQWKPSPYDSSPLYFPKLSTLGGSYNYFSSLRDVKRLFFESYEGRRTLAALRLQEILIMQCREFTQNCVSPRSTRSLLLVRDIRLYLETNYARTITARDITREFHVNYDYANRLYKTYTGQSIHNYLISTRIHRAKRLLQAGSSVSETACSVGIEDAAYFSRLFKKHTGVAPSDYVDGNVP